MNNAILTKDGLEKVKKELDELKNVRRPAVRERIKSAKDFGDLSENAEYDDARNEQSFIEGRIQELEEMLKGAKVVSANHKNSFVSVGTTVVMDCSGEKVTYQIVGSAESDPISGKISSDSPIAKAIMGRKKDEQVAISTPDGQMKCKILEVK
jgi:transcription elongation factor GreA